MQDSSHADLPSQIPLIFPQFLKGFPGSLKQAIERDSLLRFDRLAQLSRHVRQPLIMAFDSNIRSRGQPHTLTRATEISFASRVDFH
jgi:hypothetical protein